METTEFGLRGGVTRREAEILRLVGNRLSNREIADDLYISVRTVESHVSSLLAKLGASDRRALVALADQLQAPAPSHNLPRRPDSFVGRDAEQGHLAELLAGHRLVTIVGPPGVGKTRLATETALGLFDRWEDGVWLVELAGVADPDLVVPSVMAVLGLWAPPVGDPLAALVAGTATRRSLVVLDNCEHLAGSAAAVAEAVATRTDSLAVLATSRHPLGTSGERVVQLDPLSVEPSVRLFADRAGAAQDGFELTDENTESVTRLVDLLDRIPLAVELAASRIRAYTPAELVDHLGAGVDLIGTSAAARRHRTLTGAIAWSYRLLTADERLLFGRLSVFAGFNLAAAQTVCAGDGLARDKIPALVSDLVDHSLVFALPGTSSHRYRMLESIRAFAGGRLEDRSHLEERHARYFVAMADEAGFQIAGADQQAGMRQVEADLDNIRLAFDWAIRTGEASDAWKLVSALAMFWFYSGRRWEGAEWARRAMADAGTDRTFQMARGLASAAWMILPHSTARALESARLALEIATETGDDVAYHRALVMLGYADDRRSAEEVGEWFTAAIDFFHRHGDTWWEAFALIGRSGTDQQSHDDLNRAMSLSQTLGDEFLHTMATGLLTTRLTLDGDLDEAERTAEEALALARSKGDRHGAAHCHRDLGGIDLRRGWYTEAARQYDEAVPMFLEMGDLRCASAAIAERGAALMGMDRRREAKDMFGRAWRIVTEVEDLALMIYCLDGLAELSDGLIAIRLHGAAEAVRRTAQYTTSPGLATDEHVAALRSSVPEEAFTEAWEEGMGLDPAVLVARVLASEP